MVTGQWLQKLDHGNWVSCVAYNPQGTQLASGSGDGMVILWKCSSKFLSANIEQILLSRYLAKHSIKPGSCEETIFNTLSDEQKEMLKRIQNTPSSHTTFRHIRSIML